MARAADAGVGGIHPGRASSRRAMDRRAPTRARGAKPPRQRWTAPTASSLPSADVLGRHCRLVANRERVLRRAAPALQRDRPDLATPARSCSCRASRRVFHSAGAPARVARRRPSLAARLHHARTWTLRSSATLAAFDLEAGADPWASSIRNHLRGSRHDIEFILRGGTVVRPRHAPRAARPAGARRPHRRTAAARRAGRRRTLPEQSAHGLHVFPGLDRCAHALRLRREDHRVRHRDGLCRAGRLHVRSSATS